MSEVKMDKRPYRSPLRASQAEATRQRIVDAGLHLFAEHGYPGTSVAEIAKAAGVSVETIYASVGSKRGIIDELLAQVDLDGVAAQARREAATRGADPASMLAVIAEISAEFWDQYGLLVRMLRGGVGDPEIGSAWLQRQAERREMVRRVVASWPAGTLRKGLTVDRASDVAWALTSHDLYSLFVDLRRWTTTQFVDWSRDTMVRELLRS
jgi:TetR/AcrR family transcriptional regulator, regulator of cefoperazone and chloramphenicol sensitivity